MSLSVWAEPRPKKGQKAFYSMLCTATYLHRKNQWNLCGRVVVSITSLQPAEGVPQHVVAPITAANVHQMLSQARSAHGAPAKYLAEVHSTGAAASHSGAAHCGSSS